MTMIIRSSTILAAFLACSSLGWTRPACAQETFATPEAAEQALVEAARNPGQGALDRIFGPSGAEMLSSGDAETDKTRIADFLALADKGAGVVDGEGGHKLLTFGSGGWQFPIPLQPVSGGWTFDLAAGKQAMTDRVIGRNELMAIGACTDYVAAQKEYFAAFHDDDPVQHYARRLLSTEGRHDGLWWQPTSPTDISPLGDRIAASAIESGKEAGQPRSYHGYVYRILTRQGAAAPGGAYDYLVGGRLLAGFALIAYPERWGETGIMTFLCDQRGQVYERNLGKGTSAAAQTITTLDPTADWARVEP